MIFKVFTYYRLTDYYQNHRRYVKSRDDVQLLAGKADLTSEHTDCAPYNKNNDNVPIGKKIEISLHSKSILLSKILLKFLSFSALWSNC